MAKTLSLSRSKGLSNLVEKGMGGRHSDGGMTIAVFGGTGMIGRNLITRMGREGIQGIIPHRRPDKQVIHYKPMADLGQFNIIEFYDIRNDAATEAIVDAADIVVNCVGQTGPSRNFSMEDVNVQWADKLSRMCKKLNNERFVHLSMYGADPKSDHALLATKGAGENLVRRNFPESVILRPVGVYGRTDNYFTMFRYMPYIWGNFFMGEDWSATREVLKTPIFVGDVGKAVLNACKMPKIEGNTYELFGPESYFMEDFFGMLVEALHNETTHPDMPKQIRKIPLSLLKLYALAIEKQYMIGIPPITKSWMELFYRSEVPGDMLGMKDLDIHTQAKVSQKIIPIVRPFRHFKTYYGTADEINFPTPVDVEAYKKGFATSPFGTVGDPNKILI